MDPATILVWISLIAAVPVAAAGLVLRRRALAQGLSFPRDAAGWALIAAAVLLALAAGYLFWRMNTAGG